MSIGEACYPEDGSNAEELLAAADKRMYAAKQVKRNSGGNGVIAGAVLGPALSSVNGRAKAAARDSHSPLHP